MAISLDLIYQTVKNSGVSSFSFLARKLNVSREQNRSLSRALNHLVERHDIFLTYDQEYFVPQFLGELEGVYSSGSNRGYGFVKAEEKNVFVLNRDSGNALNGDMVKVRYFKDVRNVSQNKQTQLYQGYILEVVKRNKEFFVGQVILENDFLSIKPLDSKIRGPFRFVKKPLVSLNDQIKVKVLEVNPREVLIELVRIIGKADDVAIDILSAIEDANVPYRFSTAARHQSQKLPTHVLEKDLEGRLDLREKLIVTIDGDDTKDFDDAIWVSKTKEGTFWLGVYIADVAYYVPENTPLDHDAFERGTSVYLVDRVIPMLPFELSNGICSLNPDVDRLVLAIEMEIDHRGETLKYQICPAVIKSKKRLTYQAVNNYYRGEEKLHEPELEKMLDQALELASVIRRKKESEGYIDFEIEESKIIVNELGKTVDIVARERDKSEMLIEDFMVRANEMIAQHVSKLEMPFIYRVHSKPDLEKLTNLENVVRVLELDVKIPRHAIPAEFALAIRQIKALRFDDFMKVMMLRTMAKAVYSAQNIGHFGLASTYYTHFTSRSGATPT
ncbi:VacB/RNase II family 3'-5' exoribonuclease [Mycoplasma sp. ATU-Cv-508]|uniref:VacB/RNase II family 3'-5' exoribonuclease n=1 Tax=Mycoplasma sp. ATU-Cv-508 TaxID=2048001 RepID=UPI000FDF11C0